MFLIVLVNDNNPGMNTTLDDLHRIKLFPLVPSLFPVSESYSSNVRPDDCNQGLKRSLNSSDLLM